MSYLDYLKIRLYKEEEINARLFIIIYNFIVFIINY